MKTRKCKIRRRLVYYIMTRKAGAAARRGARRARGGSRARAAAAGRQPVWAQQQLRQQHLHLQHGQLLSGLMTLPTPRAFGRITHTITSDSYF